jgi:hypothetical protein
MIHVFEEKQEAFLRPGAASSCARAKKLVSFRLRRG